MALARFNEPEAVLALRTRLPLEEPEVQIHIMWALGSLQAKEAAPDLAAFFVHENADLRKMSAYISGVLGSRSTISKLKPLLEDPVADVSWNAALGLARLGDDSGWDVLVKMLDRSVLATHYQMTRPEIERVMVNAIKGMAQLKRSDSLPLLKSLAESDESLKVRQAAIDAMKFNRLENHG